MGLYEINNERLKMKKVGIIRCQQTEDMCPGNTDFKVASQGILAFEETGPVEIMGFVSCGGCPGKRAVSRAKLMVERGAEAVVFASCISRGNPIGFACPHYENMRDAIIKKVGPEIQIIEWTH
jgi:predicted metal-binding protein